MKKAVLFIFIMITTAFTVKGAKYKLNENKIDFVLSNSPEVSLNELAAGPGSFLNSRTKSVLNLQEGETTRNGYLIRACFCGAIALHRTYMGTNGKKLWWFYCCIPKVGPIDAGVDFWWVVFDKKAQEKYKNNDEFFVWLGD